MILLKKYTRTVKNMRQLEENVNRLVTRGWSTYSWLNGNNDPFDK